MYSTMARAHPILPATWQESGRSHLEVSVVDIFKDECWSARNRVFDDIEQRYDVGATSQILQYLDFALDLLFFHRLKAVVINCSSNNSIHIVPLSRKQTNIEISAQFLP